MPGGLMVAAMKTAANPAAFMIRGASQVIEAVDL